MNAPKPNHKYSACAFDFFEPTYIGFDLSLMVVG